MKEDLLQSIIKRVDIIESKLFDRDQEIDQLKVQNKALEEKIASQKEDTRGQLRNQAKVVESLQNEITREHAYHRKF